MYLNTAVVIVHCGGQKRVNSVTSCEHNPLWLKEVEPKVEGNVKLIFADFTESRDFAVKILESNKRYDVIVIDSKERNLCAQVALKRLKGNGVIIWDDSERDHDKGGQKFLQQQGFKRLPFTGMSPIVKHQNQTAIFL